MHPRQARLLEKVSSVTADCGCGHGQNPSEESGVDVVWKDPTSYDALKHGPPYLPGQRLSSDQRSLVASLTHKEANVEALWMQYLQQMGPFYGGPLAPMSVLLAAMRAAGQVHQTHHWQTRGGHYYGDHILFERIYNESLDFIDQLAERAVGTGTINNVSPVLQARHIGQIVEDCYYQGVSTGVPSSDQLVFLSLRAEVKLLILMKLVYGILQGSGHLSHGTDNLIQGMADKHEQFVYLLRQRASQG